MREIVIDTETTSLDPLNGDRIVEIGAVELENVISFEVDAVSLGCLLANCQELVLKAAKTGRRVDVDAADEQMERALRCDGWLETDTPACFERAGILPYPSFFDVKERSRIIRLRLLLYAS
jgi:hypothetical protein